MHLQGTRDGLVSVWDRGSILSRPTWCWLLVLDISILDLPRATQSQSPPPPSERPPREPVPVPVPVTNPRCRAVCLCPRAVIKGDPTPSPPPSLFSGWQHLLSTVSVVVRRSY